MNSTNNIREFISTNFKQLPNYLKEKIFRISYKYMG